jgi:hypothetical protein
VQLEYGKAHEGYWTSAHIIKQLKEKAIPAFEARFPGHIGVFIFDHSSGHTCTASDALLADSRHMNGGPGGKSIPKLRNGSCLLPNGMKRIHPMVFPDDHPTHPGQPKGVKAVLAERGLLDPALRLACNPACPSNATDCCHRRILAAQPDFKEQVPYLQELIESLGHKCLFLPKFHCELNAIEYFWGAAKHYTRGESIGLAFVRLKLAAEHCTYTFQGLKETVPAGLASVKLETIRRWEHRTRRWLDVYESGLPQKAAEFQVKQYSSHRSIPARLAREFDAN